jgi:hypothetical protein
MNKAGEPDKLQAGLEQLIAAYNPTIRYLFMKARALTHDLIPSAVEEIDSKARLLGFTFRPGTYKGVILAITPAKDHISIIFGHGVELKKVDATGLLEGTGKKARHIKIETEARLGDPNVRELILAASALTASKIGIDRTQLQ